MPVDEEIVSTCASAHHKIEMSSVGEGMHAHLKLGEGGLQSASWFVLVRLENLAIEFFLFQNQLQFADEGIQSMLSSLGNPRYLSVFLTIPRSINV